MEQRGIPDEVIKKTIEAISELEPNAFSPIMNRISNFVMPGKSITSRTFCSRESTIDWKEIRKPGTVTIFRLSKALTPDDDFRKLIMSLVIMNIFSEVLNQAREFEYAGRPSSEMTNVVLALDEFQWISNFSIIHSILTEARKFKLFLYMAHQTLGLLSKELLNTMSGNTGMIVAHRMGPDDAKYIAKLLDPFRAEQVAKEIVGMPGFDTRLRKNPIFSREVRALACTFPRADEEYPFVRTEEQVREFMRGTMEKRFGGAHEAEDLIYQTEGGKGGSFGKFPEWNPIEWQCMLLPHIDPIGYSELEEKRIRAKFYRENGWSSTDVHQTLEDLTRRQYFSKRPDNYDYVFKGRDDEGVLMGLKARPTNTDDLERTRTMVYAPTDKHKEFFIDFFREKSSRAGGWIHLEVMKKIVMKRWLMGAFCMIDLGEKGRIEMPDITVIYPSTKTVTNDKTGMKSTVSSPHLWTLRHAERIEIEENPSKDPDHVFQNFLKNSKYLKDDAANEPVQFYVTMKEHVQVVQHILTDQHGIDPFKYTVECIPIQSLNTQTEERSPSMSMKLSSTSTQKENISLNTSDEKQADAQQSELGRQPRSNEYGSWPSETAVSTAEFFRMAERQEEETNKQQFSDSQPSPPAKTTEEAVSTTNVGNEPSTEINSEIQQELPVSTLEQASSSTPVEAEKKSTGDAAGGVASNPGNQQRIVTKRKEEMDEKLKAMFRILSHLHLQGYPGRKNLAKAVGISQKTLDRYLQEMEGSGMIKRMDRGSYTLSEEAVKALEKQKP